MIPLTECKIGGFYRINSRDMSFGVYGGHGRFLGVQYHFDGFRDLALEFHWDHGPPHGTVEPQEFLEMCPIDCRCVDDDDRYDEEPLIHWIEEARRKYE